MSESSYICMISHGHDQLHVQLPCRSLIRQRQTSSHICMHMHRNEGESGATHSETHRWEEKRRGEHMHVSLCIVSPCNGQMHIQGLAAAPMKSDCHSNMYTSDRLAASYVMIVCLVLVPPHKFSIYSTRSWRKFNGIQTTHHAVGLPVSVRDRPGNVTEWNTSEHNSVTECN